MSRDVTPGVSERRILHSPLTSMTHVFPVGGTGLLLLNLVRVWPLLLVSFRAQLNVNNDFPGK